MAMQLRSLEDDTGMLATINTTPLVDVMLVLLIIFLITIPVVIKTVPVALPTVNNVPTKTKPENIVISVDRQGLIYWNNVLVPDTAALVDKVKSIAVLTPQPEVHIRGDTDALYESVGQVLIACQRGGILKVGFITEPRMGGP